MQTLHSHGAQQTLSLQPLDRKALSRHHLGGIVGISGMNIRQIGIAPFGVTADGRAVSRITLGHGDLTVSVLTWGAVLQGVWLAGIQRSLTLGSDRLADYEADMRYHGSLIGPVVNRLTGARATIAGTPHTFEANFNKRHCLHSGDSGTHLKVWTLAEVSERSCTLRLDLPDGEGGFPGNRRVTAQYTVDDRATLRLEVTVTTDHATIVNFANHSYWNLDGTQNYAGHSLQVRSDRYLPTTSDFTPTGEIRATSGSEMDFLEARRITPGAPDFDTCFCLSNTREPLREVLVLTGKSGVSMRVSTTEPAVQVYDARDARRPGGGAFEGLAIEAQNWPDAPNHAGFPSIELDRGEVYRQTTAWRFSTGDIGRIEGTKAYARTR